MQNATAPKPADVDLDALNASVEGATPHRIVEQAFDAFGDDTSLATSFGVEDMMLLHIVHEVRGERPARVFTLDTGRLHEETYQMLERAREKYKRGIDVFFPQADVVQELVTLKGPMSFFTSVDDRKECCFIRKVEPLRRALSTAPAWFTGMRASQSVTREDLKVFSIDEGNTAALQRTLYKVNPLLHLSNDDVWAFAKSNHVPTNALHQQGFPSIGCAPCTRAIEDGEDIRAGRWWWEDPDHKECGLHAS